eukprot:PhF_6_TR2187/c0_g1_i2/m.3612
MKFIAVLLLVLLIAAVCSASRSQNPHHKFTFDRVSKKWLHHPQSSSSSSTTSDLVVYFSDSIEQYGWAALKIEKTATSTLGNKDSNLWYGAGLAEGRLTAQRLSQHYTNLIMPTPNTTYPTKYIQWVQDHIDFIRSQVGLNGQDSFWVQTGLLLEQLQGITDGYNSVRTSGMRKLEFFDLFMLNFFYEQGDVMAAIGVSGPNSLRTQHLLRCSGIIKVTSNDLFMSHTTWSTYSSMIRIYKDYNFAGLRIALSGYPGLLHSADDWYQLSNGLTVQETTNGVLDNSIYRYVIPQSVSEWLRVMIANYIATDGLSWVAAFCRYNNGAYNNQYMVVNMNLYVPGTPAANLPDGLLWVTEQMPGMCPYADVTSVLRAKTFWESYNLPYFPEVFVESGTEKMYKQWGDYFSYTNYARPVIFARDAPSIQNLTDVQRFMRYNKFQTDPASRCPNCNPASNPELAIAARSDLVPSNGTWGNWTQFLHGPWAEGAIDAKIASYSMMKDGFRASIINGPTWDDQVPFQWSKAVASVQAVPHFGQEDLQQYNWIDTSVLFP